jgi:hypothetical protein
MVHLLSLLELVHDGRERHRLMAGLGEVALPSLFIGSPAMSDCQKRWIADKRF